MESMLSELFGSTPEQAEAFFGAPPELVSDPDTSSGSGSEFELRLFSEAESDEEEGTPASQEEYYDDDGNLVAPPVTGSVGGGGGAGGGGAAGPAASVATAAAAAAEPAGGGFTEDIFGFGANAAGGALDEYSFINLGGNGQEFNAVVAALLTPSTALSTLLKEWQASPVQTPAVERLLLAELVTGEFVEKSRLLESVLGSIRVCVLACSSAEKKGAPVCMIAPALLVDGDGAGHVVVFLPATLLRIAVTMRWQSPPLMTAGMSSSFCRLLCCG
jgi:hypothetical protein